MPSHYGRSMSDKDKAKKKAKKLGKQKGRALSDKDFENVKKQLPSRKNTDFTPLQEKFMTEMRRRGANPIIRDSGGKETGRFAT